MNNIKKFATITLSIAMLTSTVALPVAVFADDSGDFSGGFGGGDFSGGFGGGDLSGDYYVPDYTASYAPDYSSSYTPDYSSSYAPDYSSSYAPDYTSSYSPDYSASYAPDYTDTYGTDVTGTDVTYENGLAYSYTPTFSAPTSYGGYSSYAFPSYSYPSTPIVFNAPSYKPTYVPPTPAPKQTQVVTTPTVTTVTNTNNNVNNNNNNININNTPVTVAPIQAAPVQPIVQYVQPHVYPQPSCTISITNYNGNAYGPYSYNQLATLTWSSQNAMNGFISPNVGSVSGYGSMQVYPTNGQIYTMTVYGQGGSATCQTQAYYIPVAPVVQNPTPYVSLSQIPYTGFDFGTIGNSIYWLSLVLFAGAAAYLVLYFNGGALAVLGGNRSKRSAIAMPKITVTQAPMHVATAKVETPVMSPIQFSSSTSNARTAKDTMHVTHSKAGEMPRISISRQ